MTIKVEYRDGTTDTFTGCTDYVKDANGVSFNGKRSSDNLAGEWAIPWESIKNVVKVTT